jgi:GNAT-like C-terminal domain/N-acyltransferase N-terminal domain
VPRLVEPPAELSFDDEVDVADPVVQLFLARIPEARRLHADLGLTDEESWRTLRDLPRHARLDRILHEEPGLRKEWWVELAFSGKICELGRLQFELRDGYLAIHIPEEGGPLAPAAVDASLARARELFPHSAEARCSSWLLDPQLRELLPSGSNIVAFQLRFEPTGESRPGDADVLEFVFHTLEPDLDALPRETTLERLLGDHLRGGGHLRTDTGTLAL